MAQFNIHFFKEKSRKIDLEQLIAFFERIEGITVEMDEKSVRFLYLHPRLGYEAKYVIPMISIFIMSYLRMCFPLRWMWY